MSGRTLGLAVAALVWALALWFGFLAFATARGVALAIMAIGLAFAMYAIAGFGGAPDIGTVGFRSTFIGLGAILVLFLAYWGSGIDSLVVAAPIVGAGFGGAYALGPYDDRGRILARWVAVVVVAGIAVWVYWVDHTVYGLIAPLVTFPPLLLADRLYERARDIVSAARSPQNHE